MITLRRVVSSNLQGVGYDLAKRELYVLFDSGKLYAYPGVSRALHDEFLAAPSKGTYFSSTIRIQFPNFVELTGSPFVLRDDMSLKDVLHGLSFGF